MTLLIGLGIASDRVRAVGVRAGDVLWAIEGERSTGNSLAADIVKLLRHAALPRWPRAVVFAAMGPTLAQTKRLSGLPSNVDAGQLRDIVRVSTGRFFLRNGIPLATAGVRIEEAGSVWAAAFEVPTVHEIESACRTLGLRIRLIVPTVVAVPRAVEGARIEWCDGELRSELTMTGRRLASVRRVSEIPGDAPSAHAAPTVVASLRSLGSEAWRFADAYGATQLTADEPLALRSSAGDLDLGAARRSVKVAAAFLSLAVAAAVGSTIAGRVVQSRRISQQLAVLAPRSSEAEEAEIDLGRMSAALAEVAAFDASRRSPSQLLSQMAHVLPEGSVLVTIRTDSAGGTVAVMAPRAASVLAALDSVGGVSAPEIIGPVTKEVLGARELERATIRFRYATRSMRAK